MISKKKVKRALKASLLDFALKFFLTWTIAQIIQTTIQKNGLSKGVLQ